MEFRYSVVASSLHHPAEVDRIIAPVTARLEQVGGSRASDPAERPDLAHLVLIATGGTEAQALAVIAARSEVCPWEPTIVVSHPLHNSLPASLETLARVHQDGGHGRLVQIFSEGELEETVRDLAALHRVRSARLGLVGKPSEWLVASVPDPDGVRETWGIELVEVDIASTIAGQRTADPAASRAVAVKFTRRRPGQTADAPRRASAVTQSPDTPDQEGRAEVETVSRGAGEATSGGPDDGTSPGAGFAAEPSDQTLAAAALHPALTAAIAERQVDAVTVRCFDYLGELHTSGCVALAELNDTGIVAGCEGDIAGAVAMMIAREVLGQASWIANPASIDAAANRLLLAHCTVAPSLVEDLELHTHFESGIGIGLRGTFAPGPVTLLRLGGRRLERRWIAEAEIVGTGDSPDLCRTQVDLAVEPGALAELLDAPLGNHLVMVRGHHRAHLDRWWRLARR